MATDTPVQPELCHNQSFKNIKPRCRFWNFSAYLGSTAGKCYLPTPPSLKRRQGLLNLRNKHSSNCFHLCVIAAIHGDRLVQEYLEEKNRLHTLPSDKLKLSKCIHNRYTRLGQYIKILRAQNGINFQGMSETRGVGLSDLNLFEFNNPEISVTIFGNFDGDLQPIRGARVIRKYHIEMILLTATGENNEAYGHYILIKNKSRALGRQGLRSHIFCPFCHRPFLTPKVLEAHIPICGLGENPMQVIRHPAEKKYSFKNHEMLLYNPYCLYFLFHHQKVQEKDPIPDTRTRKGLNFKTVPVGYTIILASPEGYKYLNTYSGEDCVSHFLERAISIAESTLTYISQTNIPAEPTDAQRERFRTETNCDLCSQPFTEIDPKVLHHLHESGIVPEAFCLHNSCNLKIKLPKAIHAITIGGPLVYKELVREGFQKKKLYKAIPIYTRNGSEIGLILNNYLRINDISNYRPDQTLESLLTLSKLDNASFDALENEYPTLYRDYPNLFNGQATFPLSYSLQELDALKDPTTGLLPKTAFFDIFDTDDKSELRYNAYLELQATFRTETSHQLLHIINSISCMQLAGAMEHFRTKSFQESGLDPIYVWTLGTFSMCCGMYKSRREIEYMKCPRQRQVVEKLIRGGINILTQKICKSNSRMYGKYDPAEESQEILYIDRSLSYGQCLMQPLPIGDYCWMDPQELESFNFSDPPIDSGWGYIFECTLELPTKYHDIYRDFPIWNEKRFLEILESPGSVKKMFYNSRMFGEEEGRLLITMYPKVNQAFYYKTVKFMLNHHFELLAVHSGFKFREEAFMAEYIQQHVDGRRHAKTNLEKDFRKQMINSVSGKFLVNDLKFPTHEYCHTRERAINLLRRDKFLDVEMIGENLSLFKFKKGGGVDRNLRIVGAVILELSKLALYETYYDKLKPIFGGNLKLVFSNTDSLLMTVRNQDLSYYDRLKSLTNSTFDFSTLPKTHTLYSEVNKGRPGFFKIVQEGIQEFIAKRATQYSILCAGGNYKCTGVGRSAGQNVERHEELRASVLNTMNETRVVSILADETETLRLQVHTIEIGSTPDVTRYWISPYESFPFGYHSINIVTGNSEEAS